MLENLVFSRGKKRDYFRTVDNDSYCDILLAVKDVTNGTTLLVQLFFFLDQLTIHNLAKEILVAVPLPPPHPNITPLNPASRVINIPHHESLEIERNRK